MIKRYTISGLFLLLVAACSSPKVSTTGSKQDDKAKYSEDLSALRSKIETGLDTAKSVPVKTEGTRDPYKFVEAKHTVNQSLDAALDSIDRIHLSNGMLDGFTIQLYSGLRKEEAFNVKKQIAITLPGIESDLQYVQPNFRVRVGKYINRIEAQKDYMKVKKHFPNAVIIPDRIPIH